MDSRAWSKVSEILAEALETPVGVQRERLLAHLCNSEPGVREAVDSLLQYQDKGDLLELPALAPSPEHLREGECLGPYRVLAEIGRGGMGAVYRGERADGQFERTVAIKTIGGALDSAESERRFRAERQILAALHHPHIAELLDAGVTGQGRAYLVLEFIDGVPIDRYCLSRELAFTGRIRIFRDVCLAVHHAHQRLVIHRDLKPSNILVTADGVPKLLDFGIAKLQETSKDVEQTAPWMRCLTPNFASPEQLRGESLSITSDIYSLGIVLYNVLTGVNPYDLTSLGVAEAVRIVTEERAAPPSSRVEIAASKTLRGDLDAIVMKSMSLDPGERYQSAQEMAQDLENYLAGRPVVAQKRGSFYIARKFGRRHARAVGAAVALTIAVTAGMAFVIQSRRMAVYERQTAERRFLQVRDMANAIFLDFQKDLSRVPGTLEVRRKIMAKALEHLAVLREEAAEPAFRIELANAYTQLADVQGGADWGMGDVKGAQASYLEAKALLESVVRENAAHKRAQIRLGSLLNTLCFFAGHNAMRKELDTTGQEMSKHWAMLEKLYPDDDEVLEGTANSLTCTTSRAEQRIQVEKQAFAIYKRLLHKRPNDATRRYNFALVNKRLAAHYAATGDITSAREYAERATVLDRENFEQTPENPKAQLDYSLSLSTLASIENSAGNIPSSLDLFRQVVEIRRSLWEKEPENARLLSAYYSGLFYYGSEQLKAGDREGAHKSYRLALPLVELMEKKGKPTAGNLQIKSGIVRELSKPR